MNKLHLGYLDLYFSSLAADNVPESLDDLVVGGQVRKFEMD